MSLKERFSKTLSWKFFSVGKLSLRLFNCSEFQRVFLGILKLVFFPFLDALWRSTSSSEPKEDEEEELEEESLDSKNFLFFFGPESYRKF